MLKPRASRTRDIRSLDGLWTFALDDEVGDRPWESPLPVTRQAPVPASYNDVFVDPRIRGHVGVVWYQRNVVIPHVWGDQRIVLRVDAATHAGTVYVDDVLVAEHEGGYTPFEADVTDHVQPGAAARVTIAVDNRLTSATIPPGMLSVDELGRQRQRYRHDFFNYAGLPRSVSLYTTPTEHIADITVGTATADDGAVVSYDVEVAGSTSQLRVTLRDESGAVVAEGGGASGTLAVSDPHLWQPGAAYLYDLTVELGEQGDVYTLPVGIRTVEVRGQQLLINGEPFYLTGFGKHEDSAIRGKGHDDALLVHDFELMRWIGANSFRTSHYPYAEEWLDYADRHGIVVIDETAAVGLNINMVAGFLGGSRSRRSRPTR